MGKDARKLRTATRLTSYIKAEIPRCSETRVCRWWTVWPTCIRRGTASSLERINYTRPQSIWNFVLKREEIGQA
jgi:hypothetical protein